MGFLSKIKINQKDLVLLSYPFSSMENMKIRPALVISNNLFNKKSQDCILVPLTSVIKNELYSIIITQENLKEGKLIKTSRIKVDKIFSLQKDLIRMKIGVLDEETFDKVRKELFSLI